MLILLTASLATTAPLLAIWLGDAQQHRIPLLSCWPPSTSRSAGGRSRTARTTSSSHDDGVVRCRLRQRRLERRHRTPTSRAATRTP